jgi:hypothetical protein
MLIISFLPAIAFGAPSEITYQGRLRNANYNVDGKEIPISVVLTDSKGEVAYTKSHSTTVIPRDGGFFSLRFKPELLSGQSWAQITPFIKVTVEDTVLGNEPITSNIYANVAQDVTDGAITLSKLAPSLQKSVIPSGAILMFSEGCPKDGWRIFSELNGRFARGAEISGNPGGSDKHSHSIQSQNVDHSHAAPIFQDGNVFGPSRPQNSPWGGHYVGSSVRVNGLTGDEIAQNATAVKTSPNLESTTHDHSGKTGEVSTLPPYYNLVFCQKT